MKNTEYLCSDNGYEATKAKYAGKPGTCTFEAMIMRFVKARRKYGIRFISTKRRRPKS